MSGTSLDGLDIGYCVFEKNKIWKYKILHAKTIKYNKVWKQKLSSAFTLKKEDLLKLDNEFGRYIGTEVSKLIKAKKLPVDLIASHGHTVFHQPEKKITVQIGSGEQIVSICNLPVVCDFRSGDVMLGGQGAPLVPIVDKILFPQYAFCLNLGGFANISYTSASLSPALSKREGGTRIAFDICPVNIVLNDLAGKLGKEFDRGGRMASQGKINTRLLEKLNALPFYISKPPKSLGREWVENKFLPVLDSFNIPVKDKLRTVAEHTAIQISRAVNSRLFSPGSTLLITGGGAYNQFLIERISFHAQAKVILPDDKTIQFKEAMAFALLGVLKMRGEINILKRVTGAKKDSSGGKIFLPDQKAESSS